MNINEIIMGISLLFNILGILIIVIISAFKVIIAEMNFQTRTR